MQVLEKSAVKKKKNSGVRASQSPMMGSKKCGTRINRDTSINKPPEGLLSRKASLVYGGGSNTRGMTSPFRNSIETATMVSGK